MTSTIQAQPIAVEEGARFFEIAVKHFVMDPTGIPAESCLACAAWMAGTLLFRLEVNPEIDAPRGSIVLNEGVNQRLPELAHFVTKHASYGMAPDPDIDRANPKGSSPKLRFSLADTQDILDPIYLSYAKRSDLTAEQTLQAAVLATALLAGKARRVLGLALVTHIALHCMSEASKTVARRPQKHDEYEEHLWRFNSVLPKITFLQRVRRSFRQLLH
ncbi:MAG: hypothetical protein K5880_07325 [Hydrogenophaga sp.]|uniref:hypothetical protein n=1 Tax=Hydrogenophaga sp. TaxID=1904254 RepID=UPI00262C78AB|nr:hypothetical protein [Hydrogenophaga sp.]MCV0438426.1 hypothetical protein [Hydrogenophaga sp.]